MGASRRLLRSGEGSPRSSAVALLGGTVPWWACEAFLKSVMSVKALIAVLVVLAPLKAHTASARVVRAL